MYRENLDFEKISKALESAYQQLEESQIADDHIINELKEAETNLQQARNYSLSSKWNGY